MRGKEEFDLDSIPEWEPVEGPLVAVTVDDDSQRALDLINQARVQNGRPGLFVDEEMCGACREHCLWMSGSGLFRHGAYNGARECIARGGLSPEGVVNVWLTSTWHRAILLGGWTHFGVGNADGYWTLRVR